LGLAICRTIIERYNGNLVLAKSGPLGSVFEVTLPAVPLANYGEPPQTRRLR